MNAFIGAAASQLYWEKVQVCDALKFWTMCLVFCRAAQLLLLSALDSCPNLVLCPQLQALHGHFRMDIAWSLDKRAKLPVAQASVMAWTLVQIVATALANSHPSHGAGQSRGP